MQTPTVLHVHIPENEYWYGGCVADGWRMPYGRDTDFEQSLYINSTGNQALPLLLSSEGRYIWSETGFCYRFRQGELTVESLDGAPRLYEGYGSLKGALLQATVAHFSHGEAPPALFFTAPQYNTWIELLYHQNQREILEYARSILKNGLPAGILMIDCGWSEYYGRLDFHSGRFPDPGSMIAELHAMGFRVMLWECPFITADTEEFRDLAAKGYLVRESDGEPAIRHWWDGYSAVLDMTNPAACAWLHAKNVALMERYGVDGFKMDAGDARYYKDTDQTFSSVTPNRQSELWARFGLQYAYNEYRACFNCAGESLVQRLADKCHSWGTDGLQALVPNMLAQGILGYPYGCPDMIGGGEYMNFLQNSDCLDEELVVRYAQCSALMPMMQFSAAPWRILNEDNFSLCRDMALLHVRYGGEIYKLAQDYRRTGEPVIRYMEYVFPHQGYATVTDQFMLGDRLLVAPVQEKGARVRRVIFPAGVWKAADGTRIAGPCEQVISAGLETLPVFTRE